MMKQITLLVAFYCLFFSAFSQEKWTLEQCIEYARENNLTVKLNDLTVKQNEALLEQAIHARYPNLNAQISHNYNWGRSFDVFTNAPVTERVQSNNFGIASSTTLFSWFSITNSIKQSKLDLEGSQLDAEQTKLDIALDISTAYLQILFNRENLENARRQAASSAEQIDRTQKLVDAGVLPQSNVFDLKSQNATDQLQVVNAENTLDLSKLQLKQLLQMDESTEFDIVIPELPEPDENFSFEDPATIFSVAETTQPNVKSADIAVQSAELGIDIAQANYYPTLSLNANLNTFYSSAQDIQLVDRVPSDETTTQSLGLVDVSFLQPFNGLLPDGITLPPSIPLQTEVPELVPVFEDFGFWNQLDESLRQNIGVTLTIPIYNRNQAKTSFENARIQRERARINAQSTRNQLRFNIEQAYQNVVAAAKTYASNKVRVNALQETFRVTQAQLARGLSNSTDLTIANNNLVNAQTDLLRSKYDYVFRQKILDFYMGKELKL